MTFISAHDRVAGVAAMISLARYIEQHPEAIGNEDADPPQSEAELRSETEKAWDSMTPGQREVFLAMAQSLCSPGAYYECHITLLPVQIPIYVVQRIPEIGEKFQFHFSKIEGDEVLGPGEKWYLTRSLRDGSTLANDMNAITFALEQAGIPIARRKIEHIVFDEQRGTLIAGTGRSS